MASSHMSQSSMLGQSDYLGESSVLCQSGLLGQSVIQLNFKIECVDTEGWKGRGFDCTYFEKYLCRSGRPRYGYGSISYNYPEENCCACGKGQGSK